MGKDLDKRFKFGQNSTITLNPSIQEDEKRINILKDKGFRGKENDEKDQYRNSDLIKASEFNYLFTNIRDEFENIYQNLETIFTNIGIADGNENGNLILTNNKNQNTQSLTFRNLDDKNNRIWNIFTSYSGYDKLVFSWNDENITDNKLIHYNRNHWKFIFTENGELYSKKYEAENKFILKNELDQVELNLNKKIDTNKSDITKIQNEIKTVNKDIKEINNKAENKFILKNELDDIRLGLNQKIGTNESKIAKIQNEIKTVNKDIEEINNKAENKFILKNELDDIRLGLNQKIGTNESKIAILWDKVYNEVDKNISTISKTVDKNDTRSKKNETNILDNKDKISNNDSRIRELNTRTNNLETIRRSHEEKMKYFENKFSMTTFEQFLIEKWKFITNHSWVSVEKIDWNYLYKQLNTPGIYRDQNNSRNILLVYEKSWEMYWKDRYYSSDDYIIGKDILNYKIMIVLSKLPMMNKLFGIRSNSVLNVLYCYEKDKEKKLVDAFDHINDDQIESSDLMYFYLKEKDIYYIASHYRCYIYDSRWRRVRDYTSNDFLIDNPITTYEGDSDFKRLNKYKADNFSRIWFLFKYGYYIIKWGTDSSSGVDTGEGIIRSVDEAKWIKYKYIEKWEDRSKYLQEVIDEISLY